MSIRSPLLSAYGSYSRLSSLLARSSPSLSSSPALTRSNSIISPNFARRPPFLLDLQPFSRTYAHKSSPSPRSPSIVPSSGTSFEPITSETVISLVQAEHAKIVQSLSTSRFLPPSRLLPLLRNPEIPTLFALQTTESLMDAYTQVDQHLVGKEGKQVQAGRKAVAGAAWEVEESWQDLLKREDVTEAERKAYEGRLFPDLITISVKLEDWEMLASIIGRFHKRQIRTEDPELAEQFLNALSAFLNSSQPQTADPARSRSLTSQSLSLVLASANGRQLSSALKDLWPLLNKNRNLIPPTVFERLLPIAIEKKQVQIVEEMWDAMKSRPSKILKLYAHHYVSFLAASGRASEIPQVLRHLDEQKALGFPQWATASRSYYHISSDPIAAAAFLVDSRTIIADRHLHRLVHELISSEWGPGVTSREEMMEEVKKILEDAFGRDLWEKVDEVFAKEGEAKRGTERVKPAGSLQPRREKAKQGGRKA